MFKDKEDTKMTVIKEDKNKLNGEEAKSSKRTTLKRRTKVKKMTSIIYTDPTNFEV